MVQKNFLWSLIVMCFVFAGGQSAKAETITPVQELSFGTFALKNNSSRHLLRVARTGGITSDSEYVVMTSPTPAEYSLSGFTPSTSVTVTIPDTIITVGGGYFDVESFTPTPGLVTDSSGNATLRFGASLYSSGVGSNYSDGTFTGSINITVNY